MSVVIGVGLDAVELARMREVLHRTPAVAERSFTADERAYCLAKRDPVERFAARFAAKEAVLKVLGAGILQVRLTDIEVVREPSGKPTVRLGGGAADKAAELGITSWQLSLTHTDETASAVAIGFHDESHFEARDRKRSSAAALLFDAGRLLVVQPTYEDGWTLPGGAVDAGESPRQACEREVHEEVGLRRRVGRLLAVEWRRGDPRRGEALLWVFDGGMLEDDEIAAIVLPPDELSAHGLVALDEALALIRTGSAAKARRVQAALAAREAGTVAWLDDGVAVDGPAGPA